MNVFIGLPFYNNEQTLETAILSVIKQTFQDWKLLLIDDGSSDASLEIANKITATDSRIKVLSDGQNKGLVARLNQIIELSDSPYIARMDADDIMMPERLAKQLAIFESNPGIDVVATAAFTIDENDTPIGLRDTEPISVSNAKDVFNKSLLIHPSIVVKTEWYKKNKYDSEFYRAEDYELWCRSFSYTTFYRITEPLLLYREGNVSVKNYLASMKTLRKIFKKHSQGILSKRELYQALAATYVKSSVYQLTGYFSLQYLLTAKRNNALSQEQFQTITNTIKGIKKKN